MSNFKGPYLRVLTPVTIDGQVPKVVNGQTEYKESHLGIRAKKIMENRNRKLPHHLRHIIEEVGTNQEEPAPVKRTRKSN